MLYHLYDMFKDFYKYFDIPVHSPMNQNHLKKKIFFYKKTQNPPKIKKTHFPIYAKTSKIIDNNRKGIKGLEKRLKRLKH